MTYRAIDNPDVQRAFASYSEETRRKLMHLRQLIYEVASETEGVGTLQETLKWGQISFLTHSPKTGTTIRIDEYQPETQKIAFYVHCQTNLVDMFRQMYPDNFEYEGNRAVILNDQADNDVLKHFIELILTYHQRKKGK